MNKKKLWFIIGGAVLVLAIFIGVLLWLYLPRYRVVGDQVYLDINEVGFIFDPETGEVLGETPVTVTGTADASSFKGEVVVLGYQNIADGVVTGSGSAETTDDGWVVVHYLESCTHDQKVEFENYKGEADVTEKKTHLMNYYYDICLYPEKKDFVAVEVGNYDADSLVYVICADNEAEAKELYAWYVKNR